MKGIEPNTEHETNLPCIFKESQQYFARFDIKLTPLQVRVKVCGHLKNHANLIKLFDPGYLIKFSKYMFIDTSIQIQNK